MADTNLTNIQVYRKKKTFNIGGILFGVIFIYLVITILMYITSDHVAVYEVREGSILKDTSYTGIVLREEQVVTAETNGYVNYLATESSKVGKQTVVYSLSKEKLNLDNEEISDKTQDEAGQAIPEITTEEQAAIIQKTQNFTESYRPEQYSDVYHLKDSLTNVLQTNTAQSRQAKLDSLIAGGTEGLNVYPANDDGIIIYSVDGYENLTPDQVTKDILEKKNYEIKEFYNNTQIQAGDPVYKLIGSDDWNLVIELDDKMAKELEDKTAIQVRFSKDGETTWASFSIQNTKDFHLAVFTFDRSMIRYATERFLDIELILEDESGLKIPKSAVVNKEFYTIPQAYLTQGGDSNHTGVLVQTSGDTVKFEDIDIYYRDIETEMVYLDTNALKEGTILCKPDSRDTYTVKKTKELTGAYNVNKGYAVFRQVDILCESEEYYIIKTGNDYGLSNYDHIALDSDTVSENDLVF